MDPLWPPYLLPKDSLVSFQVKVVFEASFRVEVETVNAQAFLIDGVGEARENDALAIGDGYFYPRDYGAGGLEFCVFRGERQSGHALLSCELVSAATESVALVEVTLTRSANEICAVLLACCGSL